MFLAGWSLCFTSRDNVDEPLDNVADRAQIRREFLRQTLSDTDVWPTSLSVSNDEVDPDQLLEFN